MPVANQNNIDFKPYKVDNTTRQSTSPKNALGGGNLGKRVSNQMLELPVSKNELSESESNAHMLDRQANELDLSQMGNEEKRQ